MTLVSFPPRVPEPARTVDDLPARKRSPHSSCDITVSKDARERRYLLWPDAPWYFVGEVWFGRTLHRRKRIAGVHDARILVIQFAQELRDLEADGWLAASRCGH